MPNADEKAEAVVKRAVEKLGGDRYLQVKSQISSGNFTVFRNGAAEVPTTFVDVIAFPDRERTEFRQAGGKIIQTNAGEAGWLFDGAARNLREQTKEEVESFRRGIRSSIDTLLRGNWRKAGAVLSYAGQRQAGIGRRNDAVKLVYPDGFAVEFEFSQADGLPVKSVYAGKTAGGEETKEEDRYAQFVDVAGVFVPFIVDRFQNGVQTSRINYLKIELNKTLPDAIFNKPNDARELRKDLKL